MITHQRSLPTCHLISLIDKCVFWHSLCKCIVVNVTFWCRCGEKVSGGHQARARRRLRLGLGELEWPLVGHLLGLRVVWLSGE